MLKEALHPLSINSKFGGQDHQSSTPVFFIQSQILLGTPRSHKHIIMHNEQFQ
jgi:hypothetical protein